MSQNNIVNVAIIGQGRSGRKLHSATLHNMPDKYKIVAVVDGEESRRSTAIEELGCEAFASHEELYARKDIDLVVNATPSHLHVPLSLEFLQRGFHVLCEKPLAHTVEAVDQLIEVSEKAGKILSVFQNSRYSPSYVQMKSVIDSGILGRILKINISFSGFGRRKDWQTLKKFNGGELMNTGPHPLDQALHLFGFDATPEVICDLDLANSFGDADDYVHILLRGKGRPTIDLEISTSNIYPGPNYHVQGTNGGLSGTFNHLDWKYFKPEEAEVFEVPEEALFRPEEHTKEQLKFIEGSWDRPTNGDTMFKQYYDMLHNTITKGEELQVTPQQVRKQIAVMAECFRQNPQFAR